MTNINKKADKSDFDNFMLNLLNQILLLPAEPEYLINTWKTNYELNKNVLPQ